MVKKLDRQDTLALPPELAAVLDAGRGVHEAMAAVDTIMSERLGVHLTDLRCLYALTMGAATPGAVADETGLTSGSVTALLDRLERAGFVERRRSCADRRSVELALADGRRREVEALKRVFTGAIAAHFSGRAVPELAVTAATLTEFAAALREGARCLAAAGPDPGAA